MKAELAFCTTDRERLEWVKEVLRRGQTVTDPGLWTAGVDFPGKLIRDLRAQGVAVVSTTQRVKDAANQRHIVRAWCMKPLDPTDPRVPVLAELDTIEALDIRLRTAKDDRRALDLFDFLGTLPT